MSEEIGVFDEQVGEEESDKICREYRQTRNNTMPGRGIPLKKERFMASQIAQVAIKTKTLKILEWG